MELHSSEYSDGEDAVQNRSNGIDEKRCAGSAAHAVGTHAGPLYRHVPLSAALNSLAKTDATEPSSNNTIVKDTSLATDIMPRGIYSSEDAANTEDDGIYESLVEPSETHDPKPSGGLLTTSKSTTLQLPPGADTSETRKMHSLGHSRSNVRQHIQQSTTVCKGTGSEGENDTANINIPEGSLCVSFFSMPGEIRMQIYRYLIDSLPRVLNLTINRRTAMIAYPDRAGILKMLPKLCYVNKQIYAETVSYILAKSTCELDNEADINYLDDILHWLPWRMGYNCIRSIAFTRFSSVATTPSRAMVFIDFLKRLPSLESLHLAVRLDHIHMPDQTPATRQRAFIRRSPYVKTGAQIAESYHLRALCELRSLAYLAVVCEWADPIQPTPITMSAFFDLGDWVGDNLLQADGVVGVYKSAPYVDPRGLFTWAIRIVR